MKKSRSFFYVFLFMLLVIPFNFNGIINGEKNLIDSVYAEDEPEITDSSKLKTLEFEEFENVMSPSFSSDVTEYNISITPNVIDLIPIYTTVSTGENVTVTVTGNRYLTSNSGDVKITVSNTLASTPTVYTIHYTKDLNSNIGAVYNFSYTGEGQKFTTTMTGMYKIELWGAQGGHKRSNNRNFGGYTSGNILLPAGTDLYVFVGEKGTDNGLITFNGGGSGGIGSNLGYSGGGATDIRLYTDENLNWNDATSLMSRIMVAAGSGGSAGSTNYDSAGGRSVAGGLEGYSGGYYSGHDFVGQNGLGGTQIAGGTAGVNHFDAIAGINENGSFGKGGSTTSESDVHGAGGGGGGYYGGGSGGSTGGSGAVGQGGGGGSSYVSGHFGSIAVSAEDDITPKCETATDINCSYHYSGYKFTDTKIIDGNGYNWTTTKGSQTNMPTHDGNGTMQGNEENGYAKITLLELPSDDNYLTSLTSSDGTFDVAFEPTTSTYNLTLSAYTAKFTLSGAPSNEYATVTGLTEYKINLGETKRINIIVTSASGKSQTYKVIATRSEHELTQSSTKLKNLILNNGNYAIDFEPLKYSYDVDIYENTMEIPISAVTFDSGATVNVMNNEYLTAKNGTINIVVAKTGIESTTYQINYHKVLRDTALDEYTTVFDYTGDVQTFVAPASAEYKISLWGAAGTGIAYGAYTEGTISLNKDQELYIYVGNHSTGTKNTITFNGGTSDNGGYNGGGATDVRYEKGTNWYDFESLKTRIMVAAGGGAGSNPGAAGGLEGYNGDGSMGGTQTDVAVSDVTPSSFGVANGSCTGGNGYFPGDGSNCETGAGGGSSYISGHPGVKSISSSSTSDMVLPTDNVNHYSGYVFTNTKMIDGKGYNWTGSGRGELVGMPTFDFTSTMNGNNNGGRATIQMTNISNDNYLTSLTANIGTFNQPFSPTIYEYDLLIDKYETNVTLSAEASDSNAIVSGLGKISLRSGETKRVIISVVAPSGKSRNYIVNVTRDTLKEGEHNTKLYELSINGIDLDKPFASLVEEYNIEMSQNKYDLDINAVPYDPTAKITITGNKHMVSDYSVINIKVEADGVASTTYKIYYTKIDYNQVAETFSYTGDYATFVATYRATYKFELWGAQGGNGGYEGGKGGYVSGELKLNPGDTFYVYVGGQPANAARQNGGWNGGGNVATNDDGTGRAGGGATDIRLVSGEWNEVLSLNSRIMVAGAGGGSACESSSWCSTGGDGGGLTGLTPSQMGGNAASYYGTGGSQTSGGFSVGGNYSSSGLDRTGYFGTGGHSGSRDDSGAGGAGYYGGGGSGYASGGGGGSSYISGYPGAVAITSATDRTPRKDSLGSTCANGTTDVVCSYHYSNIIFDNPVMISGNTLLPNYTGTDRMKGNSGHGYAKVSVVDVKSQNAYLEDLKVRKVDYTEENLVEFDFDPIQTEYDITIDKYTRTFTVEGELSDENARATGFGKYTIEPGETKKIEILVTAVDGNTKLYEINVTRENETEHTTLLKNLQIDKYNLNEDFYPKRYNYTVNIFDGEIDLVVNTFTFDGEAVANVVGDRYISENSGVLTVTVKHGKVNGETIPDSVYTITYTKVTPTMDNKRFDYTGEYQVFKVPFSAKYQIDVYGAAGGGGTVTKHAQQSTAGLGGYAGGIFKLYENTELYVYVGGKGAYGSGSSAYGGPVGGWNGGGNGGNYISGSGGGATDIRLIPTSAKNIWNEQESLYSRFIVAGGGGGTDDNYGTYNGSNDGSGGSGSGLTGQGAWIEGAYYASYGGTQTNGYALGAGGSVTTNTDTGGAGGGYYGGTVTNHANGGAGAGSSYIKGYQGADTTYLEYQDGVELMSGEFREAENTGNGYVLISLLGIVSDNIYLKELTVTTDLEEESLIEERFDPLQGVYTAYLDKYSELFYVKGVLSDANSKVTGLGEYRVAPGEYIDIPIVVTAESGKTKTYSLRVIREGFREGEHSSKLSSLSVDNFTIKENFYSEKYDYTMNVYSNEIDTNWHWTTYDPDATVVITGDKYVKRSPGTITITVSAPGVEDTVYNVIYTKVYTTEPSKNDYLKSLESSNGILTPEYDVLVQNYTVNLNGLETGTRLTGQVDDAKALVTGLDKFYTVEPGQERDVEIEVVSDFGTKRKYTVKLVRANYADSNNSTKLKSLTIQGYETDIDFQSNNLTYNIVLPKGEIDLTVIGVPYDSEAQVTVEGSKHIASDTGTITVTVTKEGLEDTVYTINYTKYETYVDGYEYTGDYQKFVAPYTGKYTFELWGAQGGTGYYSTQPTPGKGAYTSGTIVLEKGTELYLYVGGQGQSSANGSSIPTAGWNGGGRGSTDDSRGDSGGAGGGATDIRLVPGNWDYGKSLASRIMVAAGGGGSHSTNTTNNTEGMAGGALAVTGKLSTWLTEWEPIVNQTTGNKFGQGVEGENYVYCHAMAGGGGGYFGGVGAVLASNCSGRSSGGSSYISGYEGSVAIKAMDDLTPRLDSNDETCINGTNDVTCSYHYSGYKFDETVMISGNGNQPVQNGTTTQVGNSGNGYIKVSMELSQDAYLNSLTSDYGVWDMPFDPLQLDYDLHLSQYEAYTNITGELSNPNSTVTNIDKLYDIALGETKIVTILVTAPNGDTKTYTINIHRDNYTDEHSTKLKLLNVIKYENGYLNPKFTPIENNYTIAIDSSEADIYVDYEAFDPSATVTVTGDGFITGESGVITLRISATGVEDTIYTISYGFTSIPEGTSYSFNYNGEVQKFVVPTTGYYQLEVWGSQGGGNDSIFNNSNLGAGGAGGYSTGTIKLYKDQVLYVYVGGRGKASNDNIALGGFNGGGAAWASGSGEPSAGGGGATDIRTEYNNLYTRFIVAGGGGGGGEDSETGGVGGGINGGNGGSDCYGTQTSGRCGAVFGYGASTPNDGGGGGGGWYGGGTANGSQILPTGNNGSDTSGGSGGSGFVLTASTIANTPEGYRLGSDWYLSDAKTVAGNAVMPTIDHSTIMYGKTGDGYALITLIDKVSKNNYLVELTSDYGTLAPAFNNEQLQYTLTLDAYTPYFTLSGRTSDAEATATGFGVYKIEPGETKNINVFVTSSSGDVRNYKVTATRANFTDEHSSLISDISINDGLELELIPKFNSKVYEYNLHIYHNLADLEIIPSFYDEDVTYKITGDKHLGSTGTIVIETNCSTAGKKTYTINYARDKSIEGYIPTEDDVITNFGYTGAVQTFVAPSTGEYIVELWGAQGNHANRGRSIGGAGAYTYGVISLEKYEKLYVYVGENRTDRNASFNAGSTGGGSSDTANGGSANGYGGGGATDVRLVNGAWNDAASLKSRIMVAAGGGGASDYAYPADGGAAGALVGYDGANGKYPNAGLPNTPPTGGTQTHGGSASILAPASGANGAAGSFGIGGNGNSSWGTAGGGGYYGGGGGGHTSNSVDSGAGGSSYISGYLGSVAIASADSLTPRTDQAGATCTDGTTDITCSYHYSGKVFEQTKMLSGKDEMPDKSGNGTTYGNKGSGYARIIQILKSEDNYLQTLKSSYGVFDKVFDPLITEYTLTLGQYDTEFTLSGTLSHSDAEVTGLGYYEIDNGETYDISIIVTSESGDTKTYTITVVRSELIDEHTTKLKELRLLEDESLSPIHGLNEEFNSLKTNYTADLFFNVTDLTINAVPYDELVEIEYINNLYMTEDDGTVRVRVYFPESTGIDVPETIYNISYHKDTEIDLPDEYNYDYTGKYQTFIAPYTGKYLFEAWGAEGGTNGGKGAYTSGRVMLQRDQVVYVYVGGRGATGCISATGGGWNGGGNPGASGCSSSGGGATDFRLIKASDTATTWNEVTSLRSRIMVAAGAGAGESSVGGAGGTINGTTSYAGNYATQTSGSAFGYCPQVTYDGSSGGGGYWGGTWPGRDAYHGGGGSSYISGHLGTVAVISKDSTTARNDKDGLTCTNESALEDITCSYHYSGLIFDETQMIAGNQVMPDTTGTTTITGKSGNGYAKITPLLLSRDYYLTDIRAVTTEPNTKFPVFDPLTDTYSVTMDKYDEWITIEADLSDSEGATVEGVGEYRLPEPGDTATIELLVTAQSGETKTYTIYVRREEFETHTTKLKDLDIDTYEDTINPRFHSLNYEYTNEILRGEISLVIDTVPYDENAIVTITTDDPLNKITDNRVDYIHTDSGTVYVTVELPNEYVDANNEETLPTVYEINWTKADIVESVSDGFGCTQSYQEWVAPYDGVFTFEAWGASGGTGVFTYEAIERGGAGAYTKGQLSLHKDDVIYVYVGCQGTSPTSAYHGSVAGGYNGGAVGVSGGSDDIAAGGGGATDFRLYVSEDGAWNNARSLASRIMVAGGGGGGHSYNTVNTDARTLWPGMAGQELSWSGSIGHWQGGTHTASVSQTSGDQFGYSTQYTSLDGVHGAGGGGGGYYGGPTNKNNYGGPGIGGSSYISGYTGSVAIAGEDSIRPRTVLDDEGNEVVCADGTTNRECSIHYSGLKFWNGVMIAGNKSMPKHDGTTLMMTGNLGNGYARISKTNADRDNYLLDITVQISAQFATDEFDNVEGAKYSPVFDKFTNTYTLELPDHVTELTLGARPSSDKATIEGLGKHAVVAGTNTYDILVTAESGEENTYTLIVTRPASDEARALNISLTGFVESICKPFEAQRYCKLSPLNFDPDTYDYYLSVPAGIRDLEWTVTKTHYYQTVIGDGVTRLGPEQNTITIEVTSESGNVQKQYTYHIFRDMTGDNYIDELIIHDPVLTKEEFDFDYLLTEYSFKVANDYTSLDMEVILDDPNATYEIQGNENFEVGVNIVEVVVTAANGEKRSYVLNVYRLANSNKLLSELHVKHNGTEFELNPPFEDITTSYQLSVPNEVDNVDITASAAYNKTTITGLGNKRLNTGLNQFNIISTAENGEAETYTIIINRAKSTNAYLTILKALEGNFNETYVKTNNNYTITVEPHVKSLNLNIAPEEANATYRIVGNENFKIGENTVKVIVTAEAGNTNTYIIKVTKLGSDINTLSTLTTNRGNLTPNFDPAVNQYSITVPNDIDTITISGTVTDYLSKTVGLGTYRLTVGNNPIDITVTSETGIANIYTVTVLREYNSNNNLMSLSINGDIVEGFDPDTLEYFVNVPNEVEEVIILGVPEVRTTTVSGNGTHTLDIGLNTIEVIAKAENGTIKKYVINITRDKSNNTNLESLVVQEAKLKPEFDPMTLRYTAKVMNDIEEVHVNAIPSDPEAVVTITGTRNLQVGDNEVIVRVTAPDESYKEYIINVVRLDENGPQLRLSNLEATNCTIDFDRTVPYYTCTVVNEITQTEVTATAEEEENVDISVTGTGIHDLEVGTNLIQVVVSATINEDEYERVYTIEITRQKSTISHLEDIIIANHTYTPKFDSEVYTYELTTEEYELEFEFVKAHEGEKIEVIGNDNLALGANTIIVRVTSEDGEHTTEYTFNVERTIRNNNYLSNLWVENENITPTFNKEIPNYKLTVPYETNSAVIKAEAEDRNAVITGDGYKTLIPGPNTFTVRVKAENNETREYRIIITRLGSPNNYLESLTVSGEEYTPEFNKYTQNYTLAVPYETDSIVVDAIPEDEDASIIGTGTINLKQGVNNVEIYVTAPNGNVRTYTIKVTRKDPITAKLLNIEVENYELDPEFTPDNPLYSVTVDYETTKLNFIITKMDPYSTYEIVGNRNLKIGLNDVYINVTASNRIDTFQYHVIVNRQAYSNTFLSSLTVSQGELSPEFNKRTLTYSVEVANNVELITIDGSPDYPLSTVSGLGDYVLQVGNNPIKVTVTSPSGIKRVYNVNVSRKRSSNANITSIRANIGTLEKEDDYTYTLYVPKYTTNIGKANFTVTTEDPTATVSMPTTIDLSQIQQYPIRVTSPDGTRTKEYTVNVVFDLSHDATLAMLTPSIGELNPEFDKLHNDYRIDLFDDEEEIYFDLYLNEVEATLLNRSLTYQLTELETLAEIMIQAEDGTVNTYRINIVKSKTKQQNLSNIEITGVKEIDPEIALPSFRAKTFEYELEVPYEVENIGFEITKRHPAQIVKIYQEEVLKTGDEYTLEVGKNTFRVEVENSIGEKTNYTYEITRLRSTNANLKSLGLSSPEFEFADFDKDILTYSAQVGYDYEDVVVHAVPEVEGSRVDVNGATFLAVGIEREITVTVTAMDGVTKKTYIINVIRVPEVDNLIKTITVSDRGKIKELTPKFRPGNNDYTITVSSASSSISVDAIPNATTTTITGNYPITTTTSGNTTTYKMEPELHTGENTLVFTTSADFEGRTYNREYTIVVNRVSDQNALLARLEVRNATMVEEFEKNKENYTVNAANDVTSLQLVVVPEDDAATYEIIGNQELGYGKENLIEIVVTSANGLVKKHYFLTVNVKGESNNFLSNIVINDESIPNFNKTIEEYELTVENAIEAIDIIGIPERETATVSGNGTHTLDVGVNDIDLVVSAQDGTQKTYTIHITREEDAYLSNVVYTLKQAADDEGRSNYLAGFDRQVYEYEIVVENDIEKINIIAVADDLINATIAGNGEYDLKVGDNPVNIVVKNGETRKVYKINVKRKGSSNTNLNYLTSTDGPLEPEFTNDNDEYEMHIPNYKTKLQLSYEPEHFATVQILDNDLSGTESTVKVLVTAEDGTERTISILVHLEDGGYFNSRLANLVVAEGTLAPRFDPDTYTYSVTVSQDDQNAHITATPEEPTSVVVGDGVQPLELGRNEKEIIVTAQDGTSTTYKIVIFRKDASNADLTGLYTDIGELDPEFSPKVYKYRIDVPEETRKVHLTAVAYSEKTIVGDGDVYLGKGETVRNIIVTSESGITNTYVVTINRALSTNHDITNITESTGSMRPIYDADTEEYAYTVGDRSTINNTYVIADRITFNVTTYSELAEVLYQVEGQEETTNNVVPLEYGDNIIYVYARSEDGNESTHYKFTVHRIHDLSDITVPGDATGPAMLDGSPNHISVQPGGTFDLLSEITYTPEDADFKDLSFTSNNTSYVTVDANGVITAADILDKSTTITVRSNKYPSIVKTVNVTVEITLISSEVYEIEREKEGYDPFITEIDIKTTLDTFLNNLDNDRRFLHVYDSSGNEILDYTKYAGTGMKVALENNGHTYDTLYLVVNGDANGDGYANVQDTTLINNHINKKSILKNMNFLAADVNHDSFVNVQDSTLINNYINKKRNSFLGM